VHVVQLGCGGRKQESSNRARHHRARYDVGADSGRQAARQRMAAEAETVRRVRDAGVDRYEPSLFSSTRARSSTSMAMASSWPAAAWSLMVRATLTSACAWLRR